jgi:hypothetical protein
MYRSKDPNADQDPPPDTKSHIPIHGSRSLSKCYEFVTLMKRNSNQFIGLDYVMDILGETRSIIKSESEALAAILAMYYRPLFGKVPGIWLCYIILR